MQVTIDIPEPLYRSFLDRATRKNQTVEDMILAEAMRGESDEDFRARMKDRYPLIRSGQQGSMQVPPGGLNDSMFDEGDVSS